MSLIDELLVKILKEVLEEVLTPENVKKVVDGAVCKLRELAKQSKIPYDDVAIDVLAKALGSDC